MKTFSDKISIFLVGMPAAGKSTLGRALAKALNRPFIDIDELVVARAGMPVAQIFEKLGEERFRMLESQALKEAVLNLGAVVALGGGTTCSAENRDLVVESGISVFLDAPDEVLIGRLILQGNIRPAVKDLNADPVALKNWLSNLRAKRREAYNFCSFTFDSSRLESQQQIDESVNNFISTILQPLR